MATSNRKETNMRSKKWILAFCAALGFVVMAEEALAVVGRPLTPVSVAGVSRRTSRRVSRRHSELNQSPTPNKVATETNPAR
jgi:hypothetical protein